MNEAPVNYDAGEAGKIIGRSAYWMKRQARLGLIPCTKVGSSYRWTPAHLAEILRAGEQRPRTALVAQTPRRKAAAGTGTTQLQAKQPRRKRDAA